MWLFSDWHEIRILRFDRDTIRFSLTQSPYYILDLIYDDVVGRASPQTDAVGFIPLDRHVVLFVIVSFVPSLPLFLWFLRHCSTKTWQYINLVGATNPHMYHQTLFSSICWALGPTLAPSILTPLVAICRCAESREYVRADPSRCRVRPLPWVKSPVKSPLKSASQNFSPWESNPEIV